MSGAALPLGYHVLPPGKLANAVTWLEQRSRPARPLAEPLRLDPVVPAHHDAACRLFVVIGTPWLWSRAFQPPPPDADLLFALDDEGQRVGVVELAGRGGADVEISYFGLAPTATGRGLGRRMMAATLDLVWTSASRVWLHTCNFDHPAALRFYRSCGFVPYATGLEIMDDPRLDGSLPREAAPHVPLIPLTG